MAVVQKKRVPIIAPVCEQCGEEHFYFIKGKPNALCFNCQEEVNVQLNAKEAPVDLHDLLKRAVAIQIARWKAEYDLAMIMYEQGKVGELLKDAYAQTGIKSIKYGTATLYLKREFYVSPKDEGVKLAEIREDVIKACEDSGLDYMVKETVNAKTLSAYINECKSEKREIPDALVEILNIEPVYKVRIVGLGKANVIAQHEAERTRSNGNDTKTTTTTNEDEDEDSSSTPAKGSRKATTTTNSQTSTRTRGVGARR